MKGRERILWAGSALAHPRSYDNGGITCMTQGVTFIASARCFGISQVVALHSPMRIRGVSCHWSATGSVRRQYQVHLRHTPSCTPSAGMMTHSKGQPSITFSQDSQLCHSQWNAWIYHSHSYPL